MEEATVRGGGGAGQLVLGLAGVQENKNRRRVYAVQQSRSTMHRRMHDLCALLNPILVDSVPGRPLFRARNDRLMSIGSFFLSHFGFEARI